MTLKGDEIMANEINIGERYIFSLKFMDDDYDCLAPYNGRECVVTNRHEIGEYASQNDIEETNSRGGLYEVEFGDRSEYDVYGEELLPV